MTTSHIVRFVFLIERRCNPRRGTAGDGAEARRARSLNQLVRPAGANPRLIYLNAEPSLNGLY